MLSFSKQKKRHDIKPLRLPLGGGAAQWDAPTDSGSLSSSSSSRRTPTSLTPAPRCPGCGSDNAPVKLVFWTERQAWVWHCPNEMRGRDGLGIGFCGTRFVEDELRGIVCPHCASTTPRDIELHDGGRVAQRCRDCHMFFTK